jgi:hypothetical protein
MLVDETLWGLSREIYFGYAVPEGYLNLIGEVDSGDTYLWVWMIDSFCSGTNWPNIIL